MEAKDYKSDQYVRFCPGCGDHAILAALTKAMAEIGVKPQQMAVISGIGCSSRMPHYLSAYGFNTIHGRGGAIATGVKTSHPELSVWQMSGDGDCLAIGGNHFIHEIRRNVNLNICLFNNRIYGLTKGQYSPTSPKGFKSKSSPFGTVERPFIPAELVMGARGTFFARTLDVDTPTAVECMKEAHSHEGAAVIECLVNCVIFNNGTHNWISDRETRADRTIILRHGQKMIFGANRDKGLKLVLNLPSSEATSSSSAASSSEATSSSSAASSILKLVVCSADDPDVLVHDQSLADPTLHRMLALMGQELIDTADGATPSGLPVALGVIRKVPAESYDRAVNRQLEEVQAASSVKTFDQLTDTLETF